MAQLTIKADLAEVVKRLPSEKMARTVMARAINRALNAGRVTAAREVVKGYAVRQRQVNEKARLKKPSPTNLEASITFSGPALNIADYKVSPGRPQPAKRPVLRVTVGKQHGQKPYKGAFLVPVRAGSYKAFRRIGSSRLPIQPVYGPSIPSLIGSDRVSTAVQNRVTEVVLTRLDHEVNRELSKGAKR